MGVQESKNWEILPDDVISVIVSKLSKREACKFARVCKDLRRIVAEDARWEARCNGLDVPNRNFYRHFCLHGVMWKVSEPRSSKSYAIHSSYVMGVAADEKWAVTAGGVNCGTVQVYNFCL